MKLSPARNRIEPSEFFTWLILLPLCLFSACRDSDVKEDIIRPIKKNHVQREQEVRFTCGQTTLAGTLFRPTATADCPAVVILAGSDRSQRGPLRISIAKHLAAHNVAALVYDSPGTGASTGNAILQTRRERAIEALAAVEYLRELPGIRSTSVGVFGGSEGADVALLASATAPQIAFVIAVSGPTGVSILDVLRYSAEMYGYKQGLTLDEIAKATTFKEIAFVFLSGVEIVEWPLIEARVKQWEDNSWFTLIDIAKQRKKNLNRQQKQGLLDSFRQVVDQFENQQWFSTADVGNGIQRMVELDVDNFFKLAESNRYDQDWDGSLGDVSKIRCPVLAIWGQQDSFLPPNQSSMRLRKVLAESNHPDYEIVVFPNATHFLTVPGSATEFVPGYLDTVTNWLIRHVDLNEEKKSK